jgi:nitrate/TMAO reductase-like tetraheme cytochrome c subunit
MGQQCVDCHKDVHRGGFGNQCQECHVPRGWKVTKDFHKNFTLTGVHYTLECAECHKDGRKLSGLSQQCMSCHQKDDVHSGTLPDCKECHRQHFWDVAGFKHSMTRFPLRGAHRTIDCLDCHNKGGWLGIYKGMSTQCQSCHAADFTAATSASALAGHSAATSASDCSQCHRNQFSFK